MKIERIGEILAGTPYGKKEFIKPTEVNPGVHHLAMWREVPNEETVMGDRYLNAARAQLLSVALRIIKDMALDPGFEKLHIPTVLRVINETLTEAELVEQRQV